MPALRGYVSHVLSCADGSSRGLVVKAKQRLPVTHRDKGVSHGIEFIIMCLHTQGEAILIANLYVHAGGFHVAHLPECILEEKSILMGDINARHRDLGSYQTTNVNGTRWKAFLDSADNVMVTGDSVPTHVQGGRLDYVAFINFPLPSAETHLLPSLLSDHSALETTLLLDTAPYLQRPWLTVPATRLPQLVLCVKNWYAVAKGTFIDADSVSGFGFYNCRVCHLWYDA